MLIPHHICNSYVRLITINFAFKENGTQCLSEIVLVVTLGWSTIQGLETYRSEYTVYSGIRAEANCVDPGCTCRK